ncbi:MAG: QueT transporter family protein [Oscillospiraceae bacterium]|jgi:uncharacterized membrane protein|nr:QueT transporter family protein [Oscillospiraceae bacterium]
MEKNGGSAARVTRTALVAAAYVTVTVVLTPFLSFNALQLRVSEILVLLCFYNKDYRVALTAGCVLANAFGPFGAIDAVVGGAATGLSVALTARAGNVWLASLPPVVFNSLFVGFELTYLLNGFEGAAPNAPFYVNALFVAAGELIVVTLVGAPLFGFVLSKNRVFMRIIGAKTP